MNAPHTLTPRKTAMPIDGHGVPIGTTLLSRFDFSDEENVRQADHEYRRCATDFDYARWARNWGLASMHALLNAPPTGWVDPDDMEAAEKDAKHQGERANTLASAIEVAVTELDSAMEGERDSLVNRVGDITYKLENAL